MGRRHSRRAAAAAVTFALLGGMALTGVAAAPPAAADTVITVTTTTDGGPGSLRAAVDTANASAQPVTIELAAATTYDLTTCAAPTEDANASGDLDLTGAQPVTIHGNAATIHQTCTGERVLHTLAGSGGLTIQNTTITGGRGPGGIAIWAGASLTLDQVTVDGSQGPADFGGSNDLTSQQAAVATIAGTSGALLIKGSTVQHTVDGAGITDRQRSGGTFLVTGSAITANGTAVDTDRLAAGGIVAGGRDLTITDSRVRLNDLSGLPVDADPQPGWHHQGQAGGISAVITTPPTAFGVLATRLILGENRGGRVGGIAAAPVDLHRSNVVGNAGFEVGGVWSGTAPSGGGATPPMTLESTAVDANRSWSGPGGFEGHGTMVRSSVSANHGPVAGGTVDGPLTIDASSVVNNHGTQIGGLVRGVGAAPRLTLEHATVAYNDVTSGGTVTDLSWTGGGSGEVTVGASVIGGPDGTLPRCSVGGAPTTSLGANVTADRSCLTAPRGNDAVGVDPQLTTYTAFYAPAPNNVWATVGRRPAPTSPAIDRQPGAEATCTGLDQAETDRPQGPACDSGAIERVKDGYHPDAPRRIYDTRDGTGTGAAGTAPLGPGETRTLTVASDTFVSAVTLNVTADRPTAASHLTVWPAGTPAPNTSNLNFSAGQTIANLVTVPVSQNQQISIRNNSGSVAVIVDLEGWYDDGVSDGSRFDTCPCGAGFSPIAPVRAADLLIGPYAKTVQLAGSFGIPSDAWAVAMNLTVTQTTAASHLTAWPAGDAKPASSNLNWPAGETIANGAVASLGVGGAVTIANNSGSTHVLVDVVGWFGSGPGGRYTPISPTRVLDTRPGSTIGGPAAPLGPGGIRVVGSPLVPAGTRAVVANITGVVPTAGTHLTAWPTGTALPPTSTVNVPAFAVRPNLATIPVDAQGRFDLRNNSGSIDALADLQGYYG